MSMHTRVVFGDGTEENADWPDAEFRAAGPARVLTEAIRYAEGARGGENHAGAWLEFHTEGQEEKP